MNKKTMSLVLLWALLVSLFSQSVHARLVFTFLEETIDEPASIDPAWGVDEASRALIFNVYETLIFFNRESVSDFIPILATEWLIEQPPYNDTQQGNQGLPDAPEGTNQTWYFRIRENVKFHDGSTLTPEDVKYSFERLMVMDRTGGPAWMIYWPLLGVYHADMGWPEDPSCPINLAVVANETHVWFNLAMPFPSTPFMQILCGSWASIVSKDFCRAHGCWDGDWTNWKAYHDPLVSPIDSAGDLMMGTGPYMLDYWDHGVEWQIVAFCFRFEWPSGYDPTGPWPPHSYEYWNGWPTHYTPGYNPPRVRACERITKKVNYEWGVRKANFETGVADTVYVPTAYLPMMILNWPTKWVPDPGPPPPIEWNPEEYTSERVFCMPGLPTLTIDPAMFFTFDVNPASAYVGTGSFPDGIPLDFFSDVHIRKAFACSFNYPGFLEEAYWNEAVQPTSCIPQGIPYYDATNPTYYYDPSSAATLFLTASADPASPAYQVWNLGFNMTITHKLGHIPGETAATMLETSIEELFELGPDHTADTGDEAPGTAVISVLGLPEPAFESELHGRYMPLFITGWLNEYTDPHDNVHSFMHSMGHFSFFQSYSDEDVDALIEEGIATADGPIRDDIYETLQLMYFAECPSVCLAQPLKRHWQTPYVQGWYHNPLYPGQKYFYDLWWSLVGDLNFELEKMTIWPDLWWIYRVDILDLGVISGHWYPGPPIGPAGYDEYADIYPEVQYVLSEDPYDAIPKVWVPWGEWIPHPSIGAVDIFDAAVVSAHWLEYIQDEYIGPAIGG